MRQYLLLIIALCLHIAARGQTIASLDDIDLSGLPQPTTAKALRYWFDDDGSSVKTVNGTSGTYTLDVSVLAEGLHTLHYQIIDETNTVTPTTSTVFLRMGKQMTGTSAKQLRYWFDDSSNTAKTVAASNGIHTIDAKPLVEGLHTLHYQVIGADGGAYFIASGLFLKMNDNATTEEVTARKLMYWFDDETDVKTVDVGKGVQMLDASHLVEGLHTIHYQVLCSNGMMTSSMSSIFLRMNTETEATTAKSLRYWFDDEQTAKESAVTNGVQTLDVSNLVEGLHTVHYQIVDSNGALCPTVSSVFLKMDSQVAATQAKSIRYWFDDDQASLKVTDVSKGTQKIDASSLVSGLHTLYYQLVDSNGELCSPVTAIFMKDFDKVVADGENRVTKYQYWLNNNSQAIQTVMLDNSTNPYTLISLLPMQKEPIRSQLFQFEMTDGQPTIYAKNDLHVRFYDVAGYFADDFRHFVDYSVKETLTNIELLEPGERATTNKPAENAIKWYQLTAEPGDSVQFCLDRTASVQLFSPSGEELLSVSGSESVNWFGCHVRESGTYYVALHDVTAEWGDDISIDYEHIDKYAVLRQDVALVGNGGCSTITFEGNGFRDLYAVDLFTEQGDSIHHVYIGHESDATTSVVFDFTDAALGTYHAMFRFAEEDKVFNNIVTVEEARDIELATTVTYPSTFLRGTSTTYTIKITNKGNMTAYAVPVYSFVKSKTEDGVYSIRFKGLDLPTFADVIDIEDATEEDINIIKDYSKEIGDDWYFVKTKNEDEDNPGDSVVVRSNYFFVQIAPNSTKTLELSLSSMEDDVTAYFTVPENWITLSSSSNNQSRTINCRFYSPENTNGYCCVKEGIECFADMAAFRIDVGSTVMDAIAIVQPELAPVAATISWANCGASIANGYLKAIGDWVCNADEEATKEKLIEKINSAFKTSLSLTINCLKGKVEELAEIVEAGTLGYELITGKVKIGEIMKNIAKGIFRINSIGTLLETIECAKKFTNPKPGCPPDPPGGGTSSPVTSLDPNDIFGYTAESGSHAVKDGLTDIYYRIEFENDTAFATASAHDIYVTDTLDATKFDLSTFKPTRIRIGEKSAELAGDKNFVTTIDMRPEINAIALVEGTYDEKKGIAKWHISSLDPMTMEPTKYVMDGVLPVNYNGKGIGEVMFDIKLKDNLAHGTEVNNRAGIVFDTNDVIMTPTWTNTIDRVKPTSRISDVNLASDTTAVVSIKSSDEGSGPWRYNVYVQYGSGAWFLAAENVPADTTATVKIYDGIEHHFYCVATDMAGNVEEKEARSEFTLIVSEREHGDVNGDGAVDVADIAEIIDAMAKGAYRVHADANGDGVVDVADIAEVISVMAAKARAAEMLHKEGN